MYLSQKQIDDYQNFGAIIIKGGFKDWIEPLRTGFQKVFKSGFQVVDENNGESRFVHRRKLFRWRIFRTKLPRHQ